MSGEAYDVGTIVRGGGGGGGGYWWYLLLAPPPYTHMHNKH